MTHKPVDAVNSDDLRRKLRGILDRVQFRGESFTLARFGVPVARIVPLGSEVSVTDPTAEVVRAGIPPAVPPGKLPEKLRENPKNKGKPR